MTALNLTQERENMADLKHRFRALLMDNTKLPAAKRDMLADALIAYVKGYISHAALAQSPVSTKIDLPPSMIARTEDIRLAHANPTSRPRSYLVRDVEALLAHIALLSSAAPVSAEGLTDIDRIDHIERYGIPGRQYKGIGSVNVILHVDEIASGGLRWAIDCMIEREASAIAAAAKGTTS